MGQQYDDGFETPPAAIPVTPPPVEPLAPPTLRSDVIDLAYANQYKNGLRVERKKIILQRGAVLPTTRCIKCNLPSDGKPLKRKLAWHAPAIYLLLFLNLLIYAIVALIVQKTAIVHVGLCKKHKNVRRVMILFATILITAPVVVTIFVAGQRTNLVLYVMISILGLLVGLLLLSLGARVVTPGFIDDDFIHIKGAGPRYLNSLTPEFQQ